MTFAYDIRTVQITRAPNPALSGYEPLEAHWRDPAMAKIGFAPNFSGVKEYVKAIRSNLGTKWGYVAFFTKYPVNHFAYASKPRLVMHYANDGWGPDNIDRVFTHETGHIFGCPDEYAASNCSCDTKAGYLREVNGNCERCATVVHAMSHGREHLGDVQLHAGAPGLARHGRRWGARPGRSDRQPEPAHRPRSAVLRAAVHLPAVRAWLGLGGGRPRRGRAASWAMGVGGQPRPDAVPVELLRQVLTPADMARVERAIRNEELRYLEALERKLRTAADAIATRTGTRLMAGAAGTRLSAAPRGHAR